jgi:hypothetical protein
MGDDGFALISKEPRPSNPTPNLNVDDVAARLVTLPFADPTNSAGIPESKFSINAQEFRRKFTPDYLKSQVRKYR